MERCSEISMGISRYIVIPDAVRFCLMVLFMGMLIPTARAALTIEITGGAVTQAPISIVPFASEDALSQSISTIISADLQRSGYFKLISTAEVKSLPHNAAEVRFQEWSARGAESVVVGSIAPLKNGRLEVRFYLMDTVKQVQLAGLRYEITPQQLRLTAHRIADVIYEKLTGAAGVFSTNITYIVKKGSVYELQVADADGFNAQTVVSSSEPLISPSWSPDGRQLAYVSFERNKPIVYMQSLLTGRRQILANFRGNNSAPAWAPDGKRLCIVLTRDGNSQLYLINADGSGLQRLSNSQAIDTEPNWSPDGKWIMFTSDRSGSPQIYLMPSAGGEAVRMTFEGSYNVSPRFSPDGRSFVFVQRSNGSFHVALQDLASGQMQVLTDTAMDESPSFAPNGRMIIYATEIGGRGVLAAVSSDGGVKQRLSVQAGDVREPSWGPLLKK